MVRLKYYNIYYKSHSIKIYLNSMFNKELPQKLIQYFKIEFANLEIVNLGTVANLLANIYKNIKVRSNLNKSFIVTQKDGFIRVSYHHKIMMDIYEK